MTLSMKLSQLSDIVGGTLQGKDVAFTNLCIDSRKIKAGELFIAIQGENFDGNDFVIDAAKANAAAAIVSRPIETTIPTILVKDTRVALAKWAQIHRQKFNIPVVAMTGSCGKTTTRSMVEAILSCCGKVHASVSSFNNDIGLPLTILGITEHHNFAVLEIGANHVGEISQLTEIAKPNVAIITNIAPVHLAGFGDLQGVANAKGEIFSGLSANGTGIVNMDGLFVDQFKGLLKNKKIIGFAIEQNTEVMAKHIEMDATGHAKFELHTPSGHVIINLPLLGKHNVMNALAAAAAACALNISLEKIKQGLESIKPVAKRLVECQSVKGATIIDDTYNANPVAVKSAIDILMNTKTKQKILVLADMRELGEDEVAYHREIGDYAKAAKVDSLYAWGDLTAHTIAAFGTKGYHFANREDLIKALQKIVGSDMTLLIKGSRSMKMELVVQALMDAN